MSNFYGYMRVSTVDQNEDRQRLELERYGIAKKNLFMDKLSGKDFNRPQYQKLKKKLKNKDVLAIKSLDRLGRNYEDIQTEWQIIVKEIKADIVVIDMPILDTRTNKNLIGTLISDIVLQLLSYVAQSERETILQRQAEGIAAAKVRGVHLGRFEDPLPEGFVEVYAKWKSKRISICEAQSILNVTRNQFVWMSRKYKKKQAIKDKED